jgi:hypothetical protein
VQERRRNHACIERGSDELVLWYTHPSFHFPDRSEETREETKLFPKGFFKSRVTPVSSFIAPFASFHAILALAGVLFTQS